MIMTLTKEVLHDDTVGGALCIYQGFTVHCGWPVNSLAANGERASSGKNESDMEAVARNTVSSRRKGVVGAPSSSHTAPTTDGWDLILHRCPPIGWAVGRARMQAMWGRL